MKYFTSTFDLLILRDENWRTLREILVVNVIKGLPSLVCMPTVNVGVVSVRESLLNRNAK